MLRIFSNKKKSPFSHPLARIHSTSPNRCRPCSSCGSRRENESFIMEDFCQPFVSLPNQQTTARDTAMGDFRSQSCLLPEKTSSLHIECRVARCVHFILLGGWGGLVGCRSLSIVTDCRVVGGAWFRIPLSSLWWSSLSSSGSGDYQRLSWSLEMTDGVSRLGRQFRPFFAMLLCWMKWFFTLHHPASSWPAATGGW